MKKQANTRRSQRRLALALSIMILILALAGSIAVFTRSDDPVVSGLRESLLHRIGIGAENGETADGVAGEADNGSLSGEDVSGGGSSGSGSSGGNGGSGGGAGDDEGGTGGSTDLPAGPQSDVLSGDTSGDASILGDAVLPGYAGSHYVTVSGNMPTFPAEVYERAELSGGGTDLREAGDLALQPEEAVGANAGAVEPKAYEYYGELDNLGRCTVAYGCLGEETMPAGGESRGRISEIHPSGWVSGQEWERSHLIAWALSAENANERNLVTGTHYLNHDGMRPLEEEVEHYIQRTGNHVLYMAKPWFSGDELVARGVQMAAWSVEDRGQGVAFNVYCFNVTPGVEIDYRTGVVTTEEQAAQDAEKYVVNTRSGVFHYPYCDGAKSMSEHNRRAVRATRSELVAQGYRPCGACRP